MTPVERFIAARDAHARRPTDPDLRRAYSRARQDLAATLVTGEAGIADAVVAHRFDLKEADRRRHLTDEHDDPGLRGCAGSFTSDADGRL